MNKIDIRDLYYTYYFIEIYIKDEIIERFKSLSVTEEVAIENSIFDEYDKEEGYEEENEVPVFENLIDTLYSIFRFAKKQCNLSLKECLEIDLIELLDYISSEIEYIEENKSEDYTDV